MQGQAMSSEIRICQSSVGGTDSFYWCVTAPFLSWICRGARDVFVFLHSTQLHLWPWSAWRVSEDLIPTFVHHLHLVYFRHFSPLPSIMLGVKWGSHPLFLVLSPALKAHSVGTTITNPSSTFQPNVADNNKLHMKLSAKVLEIAEWDYS